MFQVDKDIILLLEERLKLAFGNDVLSYEMSADMPCFTIEKNKVTDIVRFLFDDIECPFRFLTTLCGIHFTRPVEKLGVIYHLHCFKHNQRIRLKTFIPVVNPVIESLTPIFASANWMERETYDFYGIIFEGHPNLRRILNVDDMTSFPLRKDFPLEDQTRDDKNDSMFGR